MGLGVKWGWDKGLEPTVTMMEQESALSWFPLTFCTIFLHEILNMASHEYCVAWLINMRQLKYKNAFNLVYSVILPS